MAVLEATSREHCLENMIVMVKNQSRINDNDNDRSVDGQWS